MKKEDGDDLAPAIVMSASVYKQKAVSCERRVLN